MARSAIVLALCSLVLALGWGAMNARLEALVEKPHDPEPVSVRVCPLRMETVRTALHYSAVVKELEKAELAFRLGGTVASLHQVRGPDGLERSLHEGDQVPRGCVLARLDEADARRDRDVAVEKLATARARLEQITTEANLAELEYQRAERIQMGGAGTAAELDAARAKSKATAAAAAGARRDVESARIGLEQAEANLAYCEIVSPFAVGTIAARHIDIGNRVAPQQKAFLLLDLSRVVCAFGVPDTLVGRLILGQELDVTCEALPDRSFRGIVHKIGTAADPLTRTYAVEVRVDAPGGLRPGMIATVRLRHAHQACLVPMSAVCPRGGARACAVYRLVEDSGSSRVEQVPAQYEDVLDNRLALRVDASSRLRLGDRIVATGTHRLRDGQAVRVTE